MNQDNRIPPSPTQQQPAPPPAMPYQQMPPAYPPPYMPPGVRFQQQYASSTKRINGASIASLVLGNLAVLMLPLVLIFILLRWLVPTADDGLTAVSMGILSVLCIAGVILGAVGWRRAVVMEQSRGMAIAGVVMSVLVMGLMLWVRAALGT